MGEGEAIEVHRISRRYDDFLAVDDVSFCVAANEVVALLGPNGAGKTTLLRMLAGILSPTSGTARVAGHDVRTDPLAARAALGFVSGDTALYSRLTVREVLRYFGELHGLSRDTLELKIAQRVKELGLHGFVDARVGSLSAGQGQRANLARAFLTDPPVLVLDEPTNALDVVSGEFVHDAIRRARDEGRAVLLSTHDMSEAERLADRILLLARGRIAADGTREEILRRLDATSLAEAILSLHAGDAP